MKTILLFLTFSHIVTAGDKVALVAQSTSAEYGYSDELALEKGDSAALVYHHVETVSPAGGNVFGPNVIITTQGKSFEVNSTSPPVIPGPAVIKLKIGNPFAKAALKGLATFEVTRTGSATGPVPIPAEAGTTWQVILESSSDLVNWSAANPGDYPSSTPQRYFRTRLVKR